MARCAAESNTRDFPQLTVSAKLVVTAYDSEENVCNRSQFQLYLYLALDPDRDENAAPEMKMPCILSRNQCSPSALNIQHEPLRMRPRTRP